MQILVNWVNPARAIAETHLVTTEQGKLHVVVYDRRPAEFGSCFMQMSCVLQEKHGEVASVGGRGVLNEDFKIKHEGYHERGHVFVLLKCSVVLQRPFD
jgi:hypothetical protein